MYQSRNKYVLSDNILNVSCIVLNFFLKIHASTDPPELTCISLPGKFKNTTSFTVGSCKLAIKFFKIILIKTKVKLDPLSKKNSLCSV